jgi:hypothetical protein
VKRVEHGQRSGFRCQLSALSFFAWMPLRSQIVKQGPGGLVTRDAGYVVIDFTFSIVGGEIVLENGPHPSLEALVAGNDQFCGIMTSALGFS